MKAQSLCFSYDGKYFAYAGIDDHIKVWNSSSGVLEHDYKPLDKCFPVSCIKFIPKKYSKKNEEDSVVPVNQSNLLAVGSVFGTVNIYSPKLSKIVCSLDHLNSKINDIHWKSSLNLFTLSNSNTITEWNLKFGNKVREVQCTGNYGLFCVLSPTDVLLASKSMQLFSLERKSTLEKYTGHIKPISEIIYIVSKDVNYFMTGSSHDNFVYLWSKNVGESPIATLKIGDRFRTAAVSEVKNDEVYVSVITKIGAMNMYMLHLNGTVSNKPMDRISQLRIIGKNDRCNMPIYKAYFLSDEDSNILIAYGRIKDVLQGNVTLDRIEMLSQTTTSSLNQTYTPKSSSSVHLKSSEMVSTAITQIAKKSKKASEFNLPMEERLNDLMVSMTKGPVPSTKSNLQLLLQGLHSKDKMLLCSALDSADNEIINNTVRLLPTNVVVSFLQELQNLVTTKSHKNSKYLLWLKALIYQHMSHLSTVPERNALIEPFHASAVSYMRNLPKFCQLNARLELLMLHMSAQKETKVMTENEPETLLVYRDGLTDTEMLEESMQHSDDSENMNGTDGDEDSPGDNHDEDDNEDEEMETSDEERKDGESKIFSDDDEKLMIFDNT